MNVSKEPGSAPSCPQRRLQRQRTRARAPCRLCICGLRFSGAGYARGPVCCTLHLAGLASPVPAKFSSALCQVCLMPGGCSPVGQAGGEEGQAALERGRWAGFCSCPWETNSNDLANALNLFAHIFFPRIARSQESNELLSNGRLEDPTSPSHPFQTKSCLSSPCHVSSQL